MLDTKAIEVLPYTSLDPQPILSIKSASEDYMITRNDVIEAAKQCFDPEIPVNIWDLGLIYDIETKGEGESVHIRMSLTSQHCPAAQSIPADLKKKILDTGKTKAVEIQLVFEPAWTPERISEEGKKKLGIEA
jgi:metal-sulfur cluster biosynthetic enzyme